LAATRPNATETTVLQSAREEADGVGVGRFNAYVTNHRH
jgi:hypothetical protein